MENPWMGTGLETGTNPVDRAEKLLEYIECVRGLQCELEWQFESVVNEVKAEVEQRSPKDWQPDYEQGRDEMELRLIGRLHGIFRKDLPSHIDWEHLAALCISRFGQLN